MFVNKNALTGTYIGNEQFAQGEYLFTPPIAKLVPDQNTEKNGLPTFAATIAGTTDLGQYYLLDFSASHSIVWTKDCNQTGFSA